MASNIYSRNYRLVVHTDQVTRFGFLISKAFEGERPIANFNARKNGSQSSICTFSILVPCDSCPRIVSTLRSFEQIEAQLRLYLDHLAEDIELNALGIWSSRKQAA